MLLALFLLLAQAAFGNIFCGSEEEMRRIGMRIWQNEGGAKQEALVFWNPREEFLSLGIGHFLWYPQNCQEKRYEESFPALLIYLQQKGVHLPAWLKKAQKKGGAPWKSQKEFTSQIKGRKVKELIEMLSSTMDLQTSFVLERFEKQMRSLCEKVSHKQKSHVLQQIERLMQTPAGAFVLIDYVNFKGLGINPQESYNGQAWGVLQVLLEMNGRLCDLSAVEEFAECAKKVLERRVQMAPKNRPEEVWLTGWKARVERYKHEQ